MGPAAGLARHVDETLLTRWTDVCQGSSAASILTIESARVECSKSERAALQTQSRPPKHGLHSGKHRRGGCRRGQQDSCESWA